MAAFKSQCAVHFVLQILALFIGRNTLKVCMEDCTPCRRTPATRGSSFGSRRDNGERVAALILEQETRTDYKLVVACAGFQHYLSRKPAQTTN